MNTIEFVFFCVEAAAMVAVMLMVIMMVAKMSARRYGPDDVSTGDVVKLKDYREIEMPVGLDRATYKTLRRAGLEVVKASGDCFTAVVRGSAAVDEATRSMMWRLPYYVIAHVRVKR